MYDFRCSVTQKVSVIVPNGADSMFNRHACRAYCSSGKCEKLQRNSGSCRCALFFSRHLMMRCGGVIQNVERVDRYWNNSCREWTDTGTTAVESGQLLEQQLWRVDSYWNNSCREWTATGTTAVESGQHV